jgi:hypothetical protein
MATRGDILDAILVIVGLYLLLQLIGTVPLIQYGGLAAFIGILLTSFYVSIGMFMLYYVYSRRKKRKFALQTGMQLQEVHFLFWVLIGIGVLVAIYSPQDAFHPGQFGSVHGIGVDDSGNVYVVDWWHNRVQKFDGEGNFLWAWKTDVSDVTIDKDGYVYGVEGWTEKITQFTSFGMPTRDWGATRGGPVNSGILSDIDIDSKGDLYVVDTRDTVRKYDRNGIFFNSMGF